MSAISKPRILISGGGIAGNAVALQLLRSGIRTTIVERAAVPRPGGQAVDLRGASKTVAERMGLLPGIEPYQIDEHGAIYFDGKGREQLRMSAELYEGNGIVAEIEITRGDLNQVLLDAIDAEGGVDYRYGEWIEAIRQDNDGVDVTFASGTTERFDLVIGADGLHSNVRKLVFGPEDQVSEYLGGYCGFFTIPRPEGLPPHWFSMHSLVGGTSIGLRPVGDPATCKAIVLMRTPADPALRRDIPAQQKLIRERLAGGGWHSEAILAGMDTAPDYYFDELARITLPEWSRGRVVLLGDAGYCGSPLTGQGTAMAFIGAYVLAGEIVAHAGDLRAALTRYEEVVRPFADKAREVPPGGIAGIAPMTGWGIWLTRVVLRVMLSPVMKPVVAKMLTKTDTYELPEYPSVPVDR